MFYKKSVLKNFAKFTGKHLCKNNFFTEHLRTTASVFYSFTSSDSVKDDFVASRANQWFYLKQKVKKQNQIPTFVKIV